MILFSTHFTREKRFKSEFYDFSSSGLFEKFKLWIEVNSPKSKEIPNRETFPTIINSVGVKIQEISRQGAKGIKMANFIEYHSSTLPKEPIFI